MRSKTLFLLFLLVFVERCRADWWDDLVGAMHKKLVGGADFIRDEAGPAIREKFDDAKEKLQDPETHEEIQKWVREKAVPVLEEKWEQFKSFVNEDVAPEVQKIYEAAAEASKRQKQKQRDSADSSEGERERRRRRRR